MFWGIPTIDVRYFTLLKISYSLNIRRFRCRKLLRFRLISTMFRRRFNRRHWFASGLIETLGTQAFRESDHQLIDLVGQLIETDGNHPIRWRH